MQSKKGLILVLLCFLFPSSLLFAEREGLKPPYTKTSQKDSKYEYKPDDVLNVFFFPVQDSKWDGYGVLDKDWDKLDDIQKYMFIVEGTKELEHVYNVSIKYQRTVNDLIVPISQTARILALGGAGKKMIEVLNLFFEESGYVYGAPQAYSYDKLGGAENNRTGINNTNNERTAVLETAKLASVYIRKGELDKVDEVYKNGLEKYPDNALIWAARAGNSLDWGKPDEAIKYCNQSLSIKPCCEEAYYILGLTHGKNKNEDKAISYFLDAIRCNPNFVMAYYDLGVSYLLKKKYSEAVDSWVKGTRLDNEGFLQNKIESAIDLLIQSASSSVVMIVKVAEPKPWILLPPIEVSQKKIFESLLLEYKTKLQAQGEPDFVYYMNLGGISYYYRGEFEKSSKEVEKALYMLKNNIDLPEAERQKFMNYLYRLLGDVQLTYFEFLPAAQNYREALKIEPNDRNSLCGLAMIETIKGNFKESRRIYNEILILNPDSIMAREGLRLLDINSK